MNKLKLLFIFCFFSTFSFGQDAKWMVSFKTNLLKVEFEDDIYELPQISTSGIQFFRPLNIHRNSKPKLGFNFGMNRRFKVMENFFWSTGFELRYSKFEKQEWLIDFLDDRTYEPRYETNNVILDGKIDRDLLDMESTVLTFNPYPKSNPYKLEQTFFSLSLPFNFQYASKSDRWLLSSGFLFNVRINPITTHKFFPSFFENPSFGVNLNLDYRFFKNWYISFSYINIGNGIYLPSREFLKTRNQNIFSFGLSSIIQPKTKN